MYKIIKSIHRNLKNKIKNKIPAVIYGNNINNINIYIDKIDIKYIKYKIYYRDKTYKSVLKDIHFNPTNNRIIHVDFYNINKKINTVKIPVKVINKNKYNYILYLYKIKLVCNNKIPKEIKIDLSKYKKQKKIKAKQIKIPKNTKLIKQMIEENPIIISIY
ncbi:hypothetical protein ACT2CC_00150 [Candidatus Vidania fulgoroideorum]